VAKLDVVVVVFAIVVFDTVPKYRDLLRDVNTGVLVVLVVASRE
jgi:hypothetical protein